MEKNYDLIVIGAGPAGYVAAIRAAQLGMKVACVEKDKSLGGTCLNVGCIPSKALLESSELYEQGLHKLKEHGVLAEGLKLDLRACMERKNRVVRQLTGGIAGLFKKNKVEPVTGRAKILKNKSVAVTQEDGELLLKAKNILIATGSEPLPLPSAPTDHRKILDSTDTLSLSEIPGRLAVVGGGYIGLELGSVYRRWGSEVLVLEALDRIVPGVDSEIGKLFQRILDRQGMKFHLSSKVKKATVKGEAVTLEMEDSQGKSSELTVDAVLVAIGRRPYTEGLGLEEAGIQIDSKGRIQVGESFETTLPGVYAVGDVIQGPMLAHKASEEGIAVVENLTGQKGHVNYHAIPSVVYTWPELASVGLTEEQVKEKGTAYKIYKFPFMANGRALALGEKDGWVKLIADQSTDRLLGAHILGPRASDMIAELVLALEFSASAEDIARTCHAHPTLAEAVKEAALGLGSGAIHI